MPAIPPEQAIERLRREIKTMGSADLATFLEAWETAWRTWAASHKTVPSAAEDDRDAIYAGRGE